MNAETQPIDLVTRRLLDLLFVANALGCLFPPHAGQLPSAAQFATAVGLLLIATVMWLGLRRNLSVWLLVGFVLVTVALAWDGGVGLIPVAVVTIVVRYGSHAGIRSAVILWLALEAQRLVVGIIDPAVAPRQVLTASTSVLLGTIVPVILGLTLLRRNQVVSELAERNHELSHAHAQLAAQAVLRQELLLATERANSARVLHEGLGRDLGRAATQIDRALLAGPAGAEQLGSGRAMVSDALRNMRTWVRVMNPANRSADTGLAGLPMLAASFQGTALSLHVQLPDELPELGQLQNLYVTRFIQEGIANAVQHGRAANVWVEVTCHAGWLRIGLADDGSGAGQVSEGFGLASLRERVADLGGELHVAGRPGGFVASTRIPLGRAA